MLMRHPGILKLISCTKMSIFPNRIVPAWQRNLATSIPLLRSPPQTASDNSKLMRMYSSKSQQDRSGKGPLHKDQGTPQLPKFSLDGLGATPAIKLVVYTMIGVIGTVETYTYGLWIYHKLYPEAAGRSHPDESSAED